MGGDYSVRFGRFLQAFAKAAIASGRGLCSYEQIFSCPVVVKTEGIIGWKEDSLLLFAEAKVRVTNFRNGKGPVRYMVTVNYPELHCYLGGARCEVELSPDRVFFAGERNLLSVLQSVTGERALDGCEVVNGSSRAFISLR